MKEVHERLIAARGGRHWRTAEWKEARSRLIGAACEQCGSEEPPFTLQHLWRPRRIPDLEAGLRSEHRDKAWQAYQRNTLWTRWGTSGPDRACPAVLPEVGGFNLSTLRARFTLRDAT